MFYKSCISCISFTNVCELQRLGPIDRTPGIPGSDKNFEWWRVLVLLVKLIGSSPSCDSEHGHGTRVGRFLGPVPQISFNVCFYSNSDAVRDVDLFLLLGFALHVMSFNVGC